MNDEQITRLLFRADDPVQAECALVLGSATPAEMRRRVERAVAIYRDGLVERILMSGGGAGERPEAETMARLAIEQGVPETQILQETASTNTFENVRFSRTSLETAGLLPTLQTLLLVRGYGTRTKSADFEVGGLGLGSVSWFGIAWFGIARMS